MPTVLFVAHPYAGHLHPLPPCTFFIGPCLTARDVAPPWDWEASP